MSFSHRHLQNAASSNGRAWSHVPPIPGPGDGPPALCAQIDSAGWMASDLAQLRARVLAAVAAEPSLTRPQTPRRRAAALAGAGLVALALFLAAGGAHPGGRPLALWL